MVELKEFDGVKERQHLVRWTRLRTSEADSDGQGLTQPRDGQTGETGSAEDNQPTVNLGEPRVERPPTTSFNARV